MLAEPSKDQIVEIDIDVAITAIRGDLEPVDADGDLEDDDLRIDVAIEIHVPTDSFHDEIVSGTAEELSRRANIGGVEVDLTVRKRHVLHEEDHTVIVIECDGVLLNVTSDQKARISRVLNDYRDPVV